MDGLKMTNDQRGTIYIYRPHKYTGDCEGVAYAEDGQVLAHHVSSCYGWFCHDMGLEGSEWHHEAYRAKYPGGFDLVEVIGPDALKEALGDKQVEVAVNQPDGPSTAEISATCSEVIAELADCLLQIYDGPTWDGDLVSKDARNAFVRRGWVARCEGWNVITDTGRGVVDGLRIRRR